jgi:hypothetical protein
MHHISQCGRSIFKATPATERSGLFPISIESTTKQKGGQTGDETAGNHYL